MTTPDATTGELEGGCTGNKLTREPLFIHCVHCTRCQRETGSAFALNALIETAEVETLGVHPLGIPAPADSCANQIIFRCRACQVAVWNVCASLDSLFIRVGTLEQPSACPTDNLTLNDRKSETISRTDGSLSAPKFYDHSATWPAARYIRHLHATG